MKTTIDEGKEVGKVKNIPDCYNLNASFCFY